MLNSDEPILRIYSKINYKSLAPLVIFDRDDTLIKDKPALANVESVEWLPGRLEALEQLAGKGIRVAIATNQSAISRGAVKLESYFQVSNYIAQCVKEARGDLWAIATCPHDKIVNQCNCRKPKPGLLDNLTSAIMGQEVPVAFVGNADSDMEAARRAEWKVDGLQIDPSDREFWKKIADWVGEVTIDYH